MLTRPELDALHALRDRAAASPIDVQQAERDMKSAAGREQLEGRLTTLTIELSVDLAVTFSVETGGNAGLRRNMTMCTGTPDCAPHPIAIWMVAEQLGFCGTLKDCTVWIERLGNGGHAVNLVQPVAA